MRPSSVIYCLSLSSKIERNALCSRYIRNAAHNARSVLYRNCPPSALRTSVRIYIAYRTGNYSDVRSNYVEEGPAQVLIVYTYGEVDMPVQGCPIENQIATHWNLISAAP